jgi:hypothetical protein
MNKQLSPRRIILLAVLGILLILGALNHSSTSSSDPCEQSWHNSAQVGSHDAFIQACHDDTNNLVKNLPNQ